MKNVLEVKCYQNYFDDVSLINVLYSLPHSSAELNTPVTGALLWTQNDFHKIKSGLQLF